MWKALRELNRAEILSPKGLYYFVGSLMREGINLMAVLRFSAKRFPDKPALVVNGSHHIYRDLYQSCRQLASFYAETKGLRTGQKVGLLFPNSADFILNLYALSALGVDVLIINAELSQNQYTELFRQQQFNLIIADSSLRSLFSNDEPNILFFDDVRSETTGFQSKTTLKQSKSGNIAVMSGGTSGKIKTASRKPTVFSFYGPFIALLTTSEIHRKKGVLVTVPLFHGFGLSTVIIGFLLGKKVVVQTGFSTESILNTLASEAVEVMTVVPTVLQRLLEVEHPSLKQLEVVFTGGTRLNPELSNRTLDKWGRVLYNLYGSSEGGFSFMATPDQLALYPGTIGKPVYGVKTRINSDNCLLLKGSWRMNGTSDSWWNTKDLCFRNETGYYFITGRADDLIISGGENVHPQEVQDILLTHENIRDAIVLGIPDETFGERLIAFVVSKSEHLTSEDILDWLKPQLARFQLPKAVVLIEEIPMLSTGKTDRSKLLLLNKPDPAQFPASSQP